MSPRSPRKDFSGRKAGPEGAAEIEPSAIPDRPDVPTNKGENEGGWHGQIC